jgi:hypothetical protein
MENAESKWQEHEQVFRRVARIGTFTIYLQKFIVRAFAKQANAGKVLRFLKKLLSNNPGSRAFCKPTDQEKFWRNL